MKGTVNFNRYKLVGIWVEYKCFFFVYHNRYHLIQIQN